MSTEDEYRPSLSHRAAIVVCAARAVLAVLGTAALPGGCPVAGRLPGTVALRSQNYPDRFLSLHRSRLDLGRRAVSFTVRSPL